MDRRHFVSDTRGFTLVELSVAILVLLVGVFATVAMIDRSSTASADTTARDTGTGIVREVIEAARGIGYPDLLNTTIQDELQKWPGLQDSDAGTGGWQVRRNNVTYTVTATVCTLDDPKDGLGDHSDGTFCAGSSGNGDSAPDDYKRVTVTVTWPRPRNRTKSVSQSALINNPGSAFGPSVTDISTTTTLPVYSSLVSMDFTATTDRPAASVRWSVDGVDQGLATKRTGSNTLFDFHWLIANLLDGTYLITAQAYDTKGLSAGPHSLAVVLNRLPPLAPTGVLAGVNGSAVDIEWLANAERDITGYQVYRMVGGSPSVLTDPRVDCTGTGSASVGPDVTSCVDRSPPLLGSLAYYVVALDKDQSGGTRRGAPSVPAVVNRLNIRPTAVQGLAASVDADGDVQLAWNAPSSAGEPTDSIAFYRIYRDGTAVANRHARVGTTLDPVSWTDTGAGGGHQYWVSAVDTQLGESPLSGPVP